MADSVIQVPADSTGKKVDTSQITVAGQSVERQRIVIASDTNSIGVALVLPSNPGFTDMGLVVRNIPSGTQEVSGAISLATGTQVIGSINNISATVTVAGTIFLGASTANIGTLNNISATVIVAGKISLGDSTANIGTLNNISATVNVAIAAGTNNIGAVSLGAGTSNIGFINNISATVVCGLSYVIEKTSNSQVQVGDSANAALRVNVVAGSAAGPANTDNTTYSTGVTNVVPSGYIFFSASATTVTDGRVAAARITEYRGVHTNMRTDGGVKMDDSTNSALRVSIVSGGGTGGTAAADRAAFTESTTQLTPAGGVFSETRNAVVEDTVAALRITNQAGLHVNLRDSGGTEITSSNPLSVKVERQSATVSTVLVAGTANIGAVSLGAGTANIGAVSLGAGTAKIGYIQKISATATVVNAAGTALMGAVSLAAGTANIGFINNISATIACVLAAGSNNIGTINNISSTIYVRLAYVLEAGTQSPVQVGDSLNAAIRVNIVADTFATAVTAVMSTSHGPKCVTASTSANVTMIAGPGAGLSIYITQLMCSNASATGTKARIGTSASIATVVNFMAASGGGFVFNFDPPWKLSASEAALCSVKPNADAGLFTVNYYVAA